MYDYTDSLQKYHELCNIGHTASFVASRSPEAYEWLKRVLEEEAAMILPNVRVNEGKMYGPVLPQVPEADCEDIRYVLISFMCLAEGLQRKAEVK